MQKSRNQQVHELKEQVTVGTWPQQPYIAQHSPPPQREPQEVMFHHMKTVQVNSLNKLEENKHIRPLSQGTGPQI